jgi:hypothetical protein
MRNGRREKPSERKKLEGTPTSANIELVSCALSMISSISVSDILPSEFPTVSAPSLAAKIALAPQASILLISCPVSGSPFVASPVV